MSTPSKAELAAAANLSCPLLSLSNEILSTITYELHPREAIFLSLTCRALYHGVLSSQNYYLWFKVGRFSEQMPGHKAGWMLAKKVDEIQRGPANQFQQSLSIPPATSNSGSPSPDEDKTLTSTSLEKGKKKTSSKKPTRKELVQAVKAYSPTEAVVDYRRLLVETMLGDTDTGCQWCLAKPNTRKVYEAWKMRLCETCFYDNVITKHACKPLNIDISHLPLQDVKRQGGVLHGVWKPAVQRLADAKNGENSRPVQDIIEDYKDKKQSAKETSAEELAVYRERHAVAIFEAIKRQYQELYDQHAKSGFRETMFARVMEKISPEKLEMEWFMEPRQQAKRFTHPNWSWSTFVKKDPLMRELKNPKGAEKWKDSTWVEERAREKIENMEMFLTAMGPETDSDTASFRVGMHPQWDIPMTYMRDQVSNLARQWHQQRARDGGVQELHDRMVAENYDGIWCPWSGCRSVYYYRNAGSGPSHTTDRYLYHLQVYHWDVFMMGDTDWLTGRPSQWWLKNTPHTTEIVPGETREDEQNGGDYFKREVQQAEWLRKWWPDRWKEENVQVLEGWRDNDAFLGKNGCKIW